jgi:hypothetical protein
MDANDPEELSSSSVERATPETGPYVLRALLEDLPLSADGDRDDIEITCVEFLGTQLDPIVFMMLLDPDANGTLANRSTANTLSVDQNLYVGTSASEILHFFQIPPDPANALGKPSYILASRLPPAYHEPSTPSRPGVQQILLLPKVNKACILCNWTVTFYSLPELSPAFSTTQIKQCNWIGGLDLNAENDSEAQQGQNVTATVLLSLNKKMRVIRIGEDPRALKVGSLVRVWLSHRRSCGHC